MTEERNRRKEDSLEVHGPAGLWAKATGDQILHLIIVLMLGGLSAFVYKIDAERQMRFDSLMRSQNQIIATQARIMERLEFGDNESKEAWQSLTYIMTLPAEERQRLRLTMPKALRDQLSTR